MTSLLKGAAIGGITVFVWGAVSWMALPWHSRTLRPFDHDVDVVRMLDFGAPNSGIYMYPNSAAHDMKAGEPMVFLSYAKEGPRPMGRAMPMGLAVQCLGAFILSWLLGKTQGLGYWQKVLFAAAFGLGVAVLGHMPYWIWWAFPTDYTIVVIADTVIGWTLAGLVLGKVL